MPPPRPLLHRYGPALAAVVAAAAGQWLVSPHLGPVGTFLLFWPAVVVAAAAWGGFGPGALAAALAAALGPAGGPLGGLGLALFVVLGFAASYLIATRTARGAAPASIGDEEGFRRLVEGVQDYAIFRLDSEGQVASWNAGAQRIKGYHADEIIGQHFSRFYPPDVVERGWPQEELRRAKRDGRFEDEGWRVRKDGSQFWANVVITALRDESGRLRGFSKITRDLTERRQREEELRRLHTDLEKRVEERTAALAEANRALEEEVRERRRVEETLRESEQQFHMLADSIPQLAWMARPDGHIYWYNRRWYDYTGTAPEQMEGWGWQSVHDPAVLPKVLERWQASISSGELFDMVFPLRGRDGVFRPFLTRVMPVRNSRGEIAQWFGTNTDITEIRQMEEALKETARRKDEFLAMLAHELRNPLAPIRNGLKIIQVAGTDPETVRKAREMMERQIRHMTRIVDELLDVSRIQRGKVVLQKERLDFAGLVRVLLDDQRPGFEQAGVALEADLPETPLWVIGDPTRLTQVVANLLGNALKFSDRGGWVQVGLAAEQGGWAALAVRDSGIGMETAMLSRLFEPFAQADTTLDRSKGGLGLGLALVKGLAELHGGTVVANSAGLGRGAEFTLRLPAEPEPAALSRLPAAPAQRGKRLRVLVVEDSRDAAESLRMLLELCGYEVTVSYTGPAGVTAAKAWHPDVILCDIGLPGLDGYGVVAELRRDPQTAGARVIAVTGYGTEEDRQRSRQAGFDQHLVKPVDPDALQELLA